MGSVVFLLFVLPGFVNEFFYEAFSHRIQNQSVFFRFLRGTFLNLPATAFGLFVVYFWKVILHGWPMIQSLNEFWLKCINEPFIVKYGLVVFIFAILLGILMSIVSDLWIESLHHHKNK